MSTTKDTHAPADGRGSLSVLLKRIRGCWRSWRRRHLKASGCITVALLALVACASANSPSATAPCPGSVALTWFLVNDRGQPVTCADVGATSVALRLQSRTAGSTVFTAAPCSDASGVFNVPPGLYDIATELHDRNGARLAIATPQASIAVAVGRTRVLRAAVFTIANSGGGGGSGSGTQGHVAITIKAPGFESNCGLASANGAAITSTLITLEREVGVCEPTMFVRSRGGQVIDTYQVNCEAPAVTTCIEGDEVLTAPTLNPGSYFMHVRSRRGAQLCFVADAVLNVTDGQSNPLVLTQILPGC